MRVRVASVLHSYTGGSTFVEADGATLRELLDDLEQRFPGLRSGILDESGALRGHVSIFVGNEPARDLDHGLREGDTVHILGGTGGG